MGFTTGFTGGVTLTLSLAYLAVLTHQRNRQQQCDLLRAQTSVLSSLVRDPSSPQSSTPSTTKYLSRAELAAQERATFLSTAKSRWNSEIESAVRWAQTKDWDAVRRAAEDAIFNLWGSRPGEGVKDEIKQTAAVVTTETAKVQKTAKESVTETAKSALEKTKDRGKALVEVVQAKKEEGKAAVARTVEKSKDIVGRAKAKALLAEEKVGSKVDARLLRLSEMDRVLAQRYQSNGDVMSKSVEEVLEERYKPMEERDNSRLRGV